MVFGCIPGDVADQPGIFVTGVAAEENPPIGWSIGILSLADEEGDVAGGWPLTRLEAKAERAAPIG